MVSINCTYFTIACGTKNRQIDLYMFATCSSQWFFADFSITGTMQVKSAIKDRQIVSQYCTVRTVLTYLGRQPAKQIVLVLAWLMFSTTLGSRHDSSKMFDIFLEKLVLDKDKTRYSTDLLSIDLLTYIVPGLSNRK